MDERSRIPGDPFDETLRKAVDLHAQGLYADADALCREILDAAPKHCSALMLRGVLARDSGKIAASLRWLESADRAADGSAPNIICQLAISLMAANRLIAAERALRRALDIEPDSAQALANLAVLAQHRGHHAEAVMLYRRLLEKSPHDAELLCNLANTLADAGRGDEALSLFDGFDAPEHPPVAAARGAVLCALERYAEAIEPLQTALHIDPRDGLASINLALAYRELDDGEAAMQVLSAALRLDPDNARAAADLTNLQLSAGDAPLACLTCENFLTYHPGERIILASYAFALRAAGRVDAAGELLDYEHLLDVVDLRAALTDFDAHHAALAGWLGSHPTLLENPRSKSTVGGAQTGELDTDEHPSLGALADLCNEAVRAYAERARIRGLGGHPALVGRPERWALRIWGTVLRAGGHQTPHIHPLAWLSGVYYVELPEGMSTADPHAGWLEFGVPPERIPAPAVQHAVEPAAGRLVLFPAYFFHGTRRFDAPGPRISIAFDVMPIPA